MTAASTPTPSTARLFLAAWPDAPGRDAIAAWQDAIDWPAGARRSARAGWHVTLHFLGAVPRDRIAPLHAALTAPFEPFVLSFDGLSTWPGGIVVLEPSAVPAALLSLHAKLADGLRALALPVEARPFRPHVTLARHAPGARVRDGTATPPPVRWRVSEWAIVESAGGRYETVATRGASGA